MDFISNLSLHRAFIFGSIAFRIAMLVIDLYWQIDIIVTVIKITAYLDFK